MAAIFRINRLSDKFRIDARIFFIYCPLVYVKTFHDCLGFISNYCYDVCRHKTTIYDPDGPNKRMRIKYPKWKADDFMDNWMLEYPVHYQNCNLSRTKELLFTIYEEIRFNICVMLPIYKRRR